MDEPIKDAVCDRGIADLLVPVCDGHLRCKNDGAPLVTIITDLEKITPFAVLERSHGKVIQYKHIDTGKFQQHSSNAAVYVRHSQFAEKLSSPFVQDRKAITAGLLGQRTGEPAVLSTYDGYRTPSELFA